jgi:hypothetical protein
VFDNVVHRSEFRSLQRSDFIMKVDGSGLEVHASELDFELF